MPGRMHLVAGGTVAGTARRARIVRRVEIDRGRAWAEWRVSVCQIARQTRTYRALHPQFAKSRLHLEQAILMTMKGLAGNGGNIRDVSSEGHETCGLVGEAWVVGCG